MAAQHERTSSSAVQSPYDYAAGDWFNPEAGELDTTAVLEHDVVEECDEAASDLLPWADPYIAKLVRRHEQQCAEQRRHRGPYEGEPTIRFTPRAEAAPPMPSRTTVPKTDSRYSRQTVPAAPAKPTQAK